MRMREKIYIGISILMLLAILALPPQGFLHYLIWKNEGGHLPPSFIVIFAILSLITGISGVVLIVKGITKKEDIKILSMATFLGWIQV